MKRVGIREVQVKLTTLLKNLPFEITRFGKVIAIVGSPDNMMPTYSKFPEVTVSPLPGASKTIEMQVIEPEPTFQEVQEAAKTVKTGGRCEAPGQRCGMTAEGIYRITLYDPDKGEIKKELGLCRRHYQKAVKEGAEIELL